MSLSYIPCKDKKGSWCQKLLAGNKNKYIKVFINFTNLHLPHFKNKFKFTNNVSFPKFTNQKILIAFHIKFTRFFQNSHFASYSGTKFEVHFNLVAVKLR